MNVIELLKEDHEKVSQLFKDFDAAKKAEDDAGKTAAVRQICAELAVHAEVEEELFYPAVAERSASEQDEKAEDNVKEANEEHALVKALVAELAAMGPEEEQFDAKVKVLKDLVEHHVEEEEGQLMPRAKKLLSAEELEQLGADTESRKQDLKAEADAPKNGRKAATAKAAKKARPRRAASHI